MPSHYGFSRLHGSGRWRTASAVRFADPHHHMWCHPWLPADMTVMAETDQGRGQLPSGNIRR